MHISLSYGILYKIMDFIGIILTMFAPLYKHIPALSRMDLKSKDIEHETVNENHHWLVTKYHNFPCRVNHASLYSP